MSAVLNVGVELLCVRTPDGLTIVVTMISMSFFVRSYIAEWLDPASTVDELFIGFGGLSPDPSDRRLVPAAAPWLLAALSNSMIFCSTCWSCRRAASANSGLRSWDGISHPPLPLGIGSVSFSGVVPMTKCWADDSSFGSIASPPAARESQPSLRMVPSVGDVAASFSFFSVSESRASSNS